jgi:hypothetical protein
VQTQRHHGKEKEKLSVISELHDILMFSTSLHTVLSHSQYTHIMMIEIGRASRTRITMVAILQTALQILLIFATPVSSLVQQPWTAKTNTRSVCSVSTHSRSPQRRIRGRKSSLAIFLAAGSISEDEITRQLERARAALQVSRAKLEALEQQELNGTNAKNVKAAAAPSTTRKSVLGPNVPFFATTTDGAKEEDAKKKNGKRDLVIKNQNKDGLFTTDGDLMAKLSEEEEWEPRSLFDVFQSETKRDNDPLENRDVAASIYNLRRVLQAEDFQRIFDKRNWFIGEQ